jgi:hypothetical protein
MMLRMSSGQAKVETLDPSKHAILEDDMETDDSDDTATGTTTPKDVYGSGSTTPAQVGLITKEHRAEVNAGSILIREF